MALVQGGLVKQNYWRCSRSGRNCSMKALELMLSILTNQKAFDTVSYKRLIKKRQGYDINGNALRWILEFLGGQTQRVAVNNSLPSWSKVLSGVPQSSVWGPVLFILYVNELPHLVNSKIKMYAYDTKLFGPLTSQAEAQVLEDDLDALIK